MNASWGKKGLVVSVLFLVLSAAFTPRIQSADVASTHNACVDITVDAVGIPGKTCSPVFIIQ
jgi:hypothetical protein